MQTMITEERYQQAKVEKRRSEEIIDQYEKEQQELKRSQWEKQICPDRHVSKPEETDYWEPRGPNYCCSYCGSIHPKEFEMIIDKVLAGEEGYAVENTTKKYKFYVKQPGISNAGQGGIKFYTGHARAYTQIDPEYIKRIEEKLTRLFC